MEPRSGFESRILNSSSNWPIKKAETKTTLKTQAVALGLGSLFNHSTLDQNVGWERDLDAQCIIYKALREIKAGEELCINYGTLVSNFLPWILPLHVFYGDHFRISCEKSPERVRCLEKIWDLTYVRTTPCSKTDSENI